MRKPLFLAEKLRPRGSNFSVGGGALRSDMHQKIAFYKKYFSTFISGCAFGRNKPKS